MLNELAVTLPEYREWVDGLQGRIIDLLKPFSNFHYYHPNQKGSASLKKVLPALTGISYEGLSINDLWQPPLATLLRKTVGRSGRTYRNIADRIPAAW